MPEPEGEKNAFQDPDLQELDLPGQGLDEVEAAPEEDEGFGPAPLSGGEQGGQADQARPERRGLLAGLRNAGPYTVMLAVALAAILTACGCLLLELSRYDFDIGAAQYRQGAE